MKMMKVFGSIVVLLLCFLSLCCSETFEVSNADEVAAVALVAEPDTISMIGSSWEDQDIYLTAYGTSSRPIYFLGNGIKITGSSRLHLGGKYIIAENLNFYGGYSSGGLTVVEYRQKDGLECNYCTIHKSTFTSINPSSLSTKYSWITLHGRYNTFTNNTVSNKKHLGPTIISFQSSSDADHHVISKNNFLGRPTYNNQQNEQETIRLGDKSSQTDTYTVVEYNLFYEQNGELEIVSSKSNKNIFRYNTFVRCKGALTLRRADYNQVYGNQFIGDGVSNTAGVRVTWGKGHKIFNNYCENLGNPSSQDEDRACLAVGNGDSSSTADYMQVTDLYFVHNTARGCKQTIALGSGRGAYPPSNSRIAHNIFESDSSLGFINEYTSPDNIKYYKNYIWGSAVQPEDLSGFVYVNPKFKDSYKLNSNTPAEEGAGYSWVTTDITEYSRQTSLATPGCYHLVYINRSNFDIGQSSLLIVGTEINLFLFL